MSTAYVDSSCVVAVALREPTAHEAEELIARHSRLISAGLLEAEVRAAVARERVPDDPEPHLAPIDLIVPARRLTEEIRRVLAVGYLRGADLWHVACALYATPEPSELTFVTLDRQQAAVAQALGFRVEPPPPPDEAPSTAP